MTTTTSTNNHTWIRNCLSLGASATLALASGAAAQEAGKGQQPGSPIKVLENERVKKADQDGRAQQDESPKVKEAAEQAQRELEAKKAAMAAQQQQAAMGQGSMAGGAMGQPAAALPNALKFDALSHDMGNISDIDPVEHKFAFTNVSDKAIKITASASCGCTVAGLTKDTYAPGETGEIVAKFNPQGRNGPQTKTITVTVLDPAGMFGQQVLTVTSNVRAMATMEPQKMYLTEVDHRRGQVAKVVLTTRWPEFKVEKIETTSEFAKATLGTPQVNDENGEKVTIIPIEVDVGKGAPIGQLQTQLIITPETATQKVPAYFIGVDVVGEGRASPGQAIIRQSLPSTPFSTQVRLDTRSGTQFKIKSIAIEGRADMRLVADAVRADDGRSFTVTLSGVTPADAGMVQGTMIVTTDLDGGETIKVPFTASVRRVAGAQ